MILALDGFVPAGEYGHIERKTNTAGDVEWRAVYKKQTIALPGTEQFSHLSRETYLLQGLEDKSARVITHAALHRHSHNSLLDATTKIKELVAKTEFCGALTDHGNMYGFLEYYQAMKEAKKKPIIGIEAYMVDMEGKLAGNHVILLAKNLQGYKNLLKLTPESFREENVKRQKPHVTWAMLEQYHEGIICMSACLSGLIPRLLAEQDYEKSKLVVERFVGIFGDDFYIEIQNHHFERETAVRPQLVALARECGVKIVATSDSHYAMPEDREAHQAVRCLARGKTLYDDSMKWYDGDGYWLLSSEEMEERFAEYPEALDNSLEVADKCDLEIPLGAVNLPNYKIPAPYTSPDEYMEHIAKEGFQSRFQGTEHLADPVYLERFQYEIDMIKQMGFPSYFVIVWDFINFARQNNIYVGPGRGSAAGSLVAYCMGITDVDPIHYNLLFERFLNPERVSYPDIDTDIEHRGRPLVMQHMRQLYGENNVCRIITFGAFAAKRAILDMAKVLGCSSSFGVSLAKYIPAVPGVTIEDALEQSYELSSAYDDFEDLAVQAIAKGLFAFAVYDDGEEDKTIFPNINIVTSGNVACMMEAYREFMLEETVFDHICRVAKKIPYNARNGCPVGFMVDGGELVFSDSDPARYANKDGAETAFIDILRRCGEQVEKAPRTGALKQTIVLADV